MIDEHYFKDIKEAVRCKDKRRPYLQSIYFRTYGEIAEFFDIGTTTLKVIRRSRTFNKYLENRKSESRPEVKA